jgi:hypothetical protein
MLFPPSLSLTSLLGAFILHQEHTDLTITCAGQSRTLAVPPHQSLRTEIDEWNRRLQSLEAVGGSPKEKEKEEAVGEVARALEKLMQIYGHNA